MCQSNDVFNLWNVIIDNLMFEYNDQVIDLSTVKFFAIDICLEYEMVDQGAFSQRS